MAHELTLAKQDVTILFRHINRLNSMANTKLTVNRVSNKNVFTSQSAIKGAIAETINSDKNQKIDNLIVSTKAFQTVAALNPYVQRLTPESTVLFIHNGMGLIDQCVDKFWPLPSQRPNIYKAIVTHGAYKTSPSVINHVGLGSMVISRLSSEQHGSDNVPEFLGKILEIPALNAHLVNRNQFVLKEIEKLAANACINPLTAIFDCSNGELLYGSKIVQMMRRIVWELIACVRAEHSAVLKQIPLAHTHLDPQRMLDSVFSILKATSQNSSSMREDVRNLNNTEVDYINGYISRIGGKHSIPTPVNNMIVSMIKTKLSIERSIDNQIGR